MSHGAPLALLAAALLLPPTLARAEARTRSLTLARADSAWARRDWSTARRLYSAVFARQPQQSRAVFRLARLTDDQGQALRLYRRYIALEPGDPWGHVAAGDVLSRLGRFHQALEEYDRAAWVAPAGRDVVVGRARVLDLAQRPDEAAAVRESWLFDHPGDAAVWGDLGNTWLKAGRPRRAVHALERVLAIGPNRVAERRLQLARALDAPAVEPLVTSSRDSDGNRIFGAGLGADIAVGDGVRLGVQVQRTQVADDATRGFVDDARVRLTLRPPSTGRIEVAAGKASLDPRDGTPPTARWIGGLSARWRAAGGSSVLEVRAERAPLAANPSLLANHAMRNEGRGGLELPMGALRLRGTLRGAMIESAKLRNWRGAAEAALAVALDPAVTPCVRVRVSGYHHPANTGYFSPRLAESVEAGSSFELRGNSPWSLTLDLGGGLQRHAAHGQPVGPWGPAFRSYAYLSYAAGRGRELRLEAESENSPGLVTSTSENWHYLSLNLAMRWAVR